MLLTDFDVTLIVSFVKNFDAGFDQDIPQLILRGWAGNNENG